MKQFLFFIFFACFSLFAYGESLNLHEGPMKADELEFLIKKISEKYISCYGTKSSDNSILPRCFMGLSECEKANNQALKAGVIDFEGYTVLIREEFCVHLSFSMNDNINVNVLPTAEKFSTYLKL